MVQWQLLSLILPFYSLLMVALWVTVTFSEGLSDDIERLCTRYDSACTYVGSNDVL